MRAWRAGRQEARQHGFATDWEITGGRALYQQHVGRGESAAWDDVLWPSSANAEELAESHLLGICHIAPAKRSAVRSEAALLPRPRQEGPRRQLPFHVKHQSGEVGPRRPHVRERTRGGWTAAVLAGGARPTFVASNLRTGDRTTNLNTIADCVGGVRRPVR